MDTDLIDATTEPDPESAPPATPGPTGAAAPVAGAGTAAVAGVFSALLGLSATEVVSAPGNGGTSLITAVASRFIERFAGSLKELAISLFGTNDKPALIVGIVIVSCAVGAGLGVLGRRRRALALAGIVVWSAIGAWAGVLDPFASTWRMIAAAAVGAVVACGSYTWLAAQVRPSRTMVGGDDRRGFLLGITGAGSLAAIAFGMSKVLRTTTWNGTGADDVVLPAPAPAPAAGGPASAPLAALDVPGITPVITPIADFYRIDTALVVPRVDASSWKLRFEGLVDTPFELTYDEILAMDLVEVPLTISCVSNEVGGDLVGTANWRGVPLSQLLDRAGVQAGGTQIIAESVDGFTAGFPTSLVGDGRVALLAIGMNGEPLPARHGFPARLVVGGIYGYVSATKWLSRIRLTGWDDEDGFWIPRGWSKEGPIKLTSRIDVPRAGEQVVAGRTPIAGVAWAPNRGIGGVEVSIDGGPWQAARLGDSSDDNVWVQWVLEWDASDGEHEIAVRAIAADGEVQTDERAPVAPDGASGHHRRRVTVSA